MRACTALVGLGFCTALSIGNASGPALAQCTFEWRPGESVASVNGDVAAVTNWDPDGDGPQPEWLVVGGYFSVAGDVPVHNLAAWDGKSWHDVGGGVDGGVVSLTVYNGHLIVGGLFT